MRNDPVFLFDLTLQSLFFYGLRVRLLAHLRVIQLHMRHKEKSEL